MMTATCGSTFSITAARAIAAALVLACTVGAKKKDSAGEHLLRNPAPGFSVNSVNAGRQALSAYKGRIVLLDFWATWCGPCRKEMPALKKLWERYKDKEFALLGVSLDKDRKALKDYLRENDIGWPILFDGRGWHNRIAAKYRVRGIPFTVLIDRKGIVRKVGLRGKALEEAVGEMISSPGG